MHAGSTKTPPLVSSNANLSVPRIENCIGGLPREKPEVTLGDSHAVLLQNTPWLFANHKSSKHFVVIALNPAAELLHLFNDLLPKNPALKRLETVHQGAQDATGSGSFYLHRIT